MRVAAGLIGALALAVFPGTQASATTYAVALTGTIISQDSPGVDPIAKVGDKVYFTGRFDQNNVVQWGGFGYSVAGVRDDIPFPPELFKIVLNHLKWYGTDDQFYGTDFYVNPITDKGLMYPGIVFANGKVLGVDGDLIPQNNSTTPELDLAAGLGVTFHGDPSFSFFPLAFNPYFDIFSAGGAYGNTASTLGFVGTWDFAGSSVTVVPEPDTWALLLAGFGLSGLVLRGRKSWLTPQQA